MTDFGSIFNLRPSQPPPYPSRVNVVVIVVVFYAITTTMTTVTTTMSMTIAPHTITRITRSVTILPCDLAC